MIKAQVVAYSENIFGNKLASVIATMPRWILAELNTHRMFSRNSASSRAVPFYKPSATTDMYRMINENPCYPIAWQKEHSGMQGTEYLDDVDSFDLDNKFVDGIPAKELFEQMWAKDGNYQRRWGSASYNALQVAKELHDFGVTKQLCNRLIEPFMWHTVLITADEWENFFNLRCPQYKLDWGHLQSDYVRSKKDYRKARLAAGSTQEYFDSVNRGLDSMTELDWHKLNFGQAEIHMMAVAEAIYDALNEATPKILQPGEWHIPFGDNLDEERIIETLSELSLKDQIIFGKSVIPDINTAKIQIATARCARVSYLNYEGKDDYEADFKLYKRLMDSGSSSSFHASPFEHCAVAMGPEDLDNYILIEDGKTFPGRCRNFTGFIQNRVIIEKQFSK